MSAVPEPRVLYQETNPYGSFSAFLEEDGRTIYLYIQSQNNPSWQMKTLWVRNLIPAPESRDPEDFDKGLAPLLTKAEVKNPEALPLLKVDDLHFIWSEEGDSVALFEKEELIAYIPPWSGIKGVHGYAKEAKESAITASPLGDGSHGVLVDRVELARKFWESASQPNQWKKIQDHRLRFLEEQFGTHQTYWSADGGKYPKLGIASFLPPAFPGIKIFSTIGMSAQNQPSVELYHKDFEDFARIELVFAYKLPTDAPDQSEKWVQHALGEMVKFPWNTGIWFGHSHTIQNPRKDPDQLYQNFSWFALRNVTEELDENPDLLLPKLHGLVSENGRRVNFLFLLPIGDEEKLNFVRTGSQVFWKSWQEAGHTFFHDSERKILEF